MDPVFALHLTFVIFFLSIPFWPQRYLIYGALAPITLATVWQVFRGCPLTHIQTNLNDEYFSSILIKPFIPNVTNEEVSRLTYWILLVVATIAFFRLCPQLWEKIFQRSNDDNDNKTDQN